MSINLEGATEAISTIFGQLADDKSIWSYAIAAAVTMTVVYLISQLSFDYAWYAAIVAGAAAEIIVTFFCAAAFGTELNIIMTNVGIIIGTLLAVFLQFMKCAVDYSREEYIQFEDDDYYYYVKAVPKINVANADVRIKHINAKKTKKTDDIRQMRTGDTAKDNGYAVSNEEDDDILFYDDDK